MTDNYPHRFDSDALTQNPPSFAIVRKGFDQSQVASYLRSVQGSLVEAMKERAQLEAQVQELHERIENPDLDIEKITEIFGRQASEILRGAHDAAEAIRQRADSVSKETIARAAREGAEIVSRANLDAEAQLDEAAGSSQEILETARSQAHDTIVVAEQGASAILERAKVEGRAVILRARELRSKIFAETQARIDELQLEIQGLEDSRTVLIQLIRSARRMLDEMAEVLEEDTTVRADVTPEAGEAALELVGVEPLLAQSFDKSETTGAGSLAEESAQSAVEWAESSPVAEFDHDDSFQSSGTPVEVQESETTVLDTLSLNRQGETGEAEEVTTVQEQQLEELLDVPSADISLSSASEPAPHVEPPLSESTAKRTPREDGLRIESGGDPVSVSGENLSVADSLQGFLARRSAHRGLNPHDEIGPTADAWSAANPPVLGDEPADLGPTTDQETVHGDHRLLRLEDLFGRLKITESLSGERDGDDEIHKEERRVEALGADVLVDLSSSATSSISREPVAGGAPTTEGDKGSDGAGVDTEISTAVSQEPTDVERIDLNDAGPIHGVTTRSRTQSDSELIAMRDASIGPIATSLGRRVKRMLQDDQNDLLDLLRQGGIAQVLERAVELSAGRGRRMPQMIELLQKSEREGRGFGERLRGNPKKTTEALENSSSEADLESMADQCLDVVVSLTLGRIGSMTSALEAANESGQISILGSIFRDVRGQKVDELVGDLVGSAFALGVRAVGGAVGYRWLTSDLGVNCADCDDNALANVNPSEEEFPTGHRLPPVHGGCRCLIVPVFA
jgi:cell division septum initiation protein DivIVA